MRCDVRYIPCGLSLCTPQYAGPRWTANRQSLQSKIGKVLINQAPSIIESCESYFALLLSQLLHHLTSIHLVRSLSLGLPCLNVSPLNALKLPEMMFCHADVGAGVGVSLSSCRPRSTSESDSPLAESSPALVGIGMLAVGESLTVSATCPCTSAVEVSSPSVLLLLSSALGEARRERTTS
jgi:hypothetical protein